MIYEPIGVYSKTGYHIDSMSVTVHCFEELAHLIVERFYDVGDFLMSGELISFIAGELALHDLADRLNDARNDISEYTEILLSYRHYMSDDAVAGVCRSITDGADAKEYVRLVSRGDYLKEHKRYRSAILLYEHARELMDEESEQSGMVYRDLLGKLGRLYAVYFMFDKACEVFGTAGDSKRAAFCRKLSMSRVEYADHLLKDKGDESYSSEIDEMMKEDPDIAEIKLRLKEQKTYGAQLARERLSSRLKAEYRRIL